MNIERLGSIPCKWSGFSLLIEKLTSLIGVALQKAYVEWIEAAARIAEPKGRPKLSGGGRYGKAQLSPPSASSYERARQIAESIRALPNKYEVK